MLLDFGAARRVISDRSQTLTAILKPNYAPIEQYAESTGLRQGPWTDFYALGATLHLPDHRQATDAGHRAHVQRRPAAAGRLGQGRGVRERCCRCATGCSRRDRRIVRRTWPRCAPHWWAPADAHAYRGIAGSGLAGHRCAAAVCRARSAAAQDEHGRDVVRFRCGDYAWPPAWCGSTGIRGVGDAGRRRRHAGAVAVHSRADSRSGWRGCTAVARRGGILAGRRHTGGGRIDSGIHSVAERIGCVGIGKCGHGGGASACGHASRRVHLRHHGAHESAAQGRHARCRADRAECGCPDTADADCADAGSRPAHSGRHRSD